jgi:hypothetical protein
MEWDTIMAENERTGEYKSTNVEKKADYTIVATTFIKYTAYIIIFFGFLYFIVKYVLPLVE